MASREVCRYPLVMKALWNWLAARLPWIAAKRARERAAFYERDPGFGEF